jgi:hypothetical protein
MARATQKKIDEKGISIPPTMNMTTANMMDGS